jgi:hypothetical protein
MTDDVPGDSKRFSFAMISAFFAAADRFPKRFHPVKNVFGSAPLTPDIEVRPVFVL